MADPNEQAATQLRKIENDTGKTLADFVAAISAAELTKHGQMMTYLKSEEGLTHGNANLIAHRVREILEGGPAADVDLLDAQYANAKAVLRPIYESLAAAATGLGSDVEQVVQKTGVSFRRRKQFALVQCPSSKRVRLSLNLDATPKDHRVKETTGMCTHGIDLVSVDEVDDDVITWLGTAYDLAG